MRRILGLIGVCVLAAAGCKHVGGKCDCGPTPGEATTYAPYTNNTPVRVESVGTPKEMPNMNMKK